MKIIILGTAYPLRGGIAHFNALLALHLSGRHEVETITFKRQYPNFLFPGKTQEETGEIGEVAPAPELIDSINPFNWFTVARHVARLKPDLLIFKYWLPFFGPCFGTIARLVKRRTGARVLFICDNVIPHERRPGDVAFTKYAFRTVDWFIVQSASVERDLKQIRPDAVYRKVPHPVYENFGSPIPKEEARAALGILAKKIMLFFGYIRPYKGLFVLLEAMHLLAESGMNDLLLLVVGECYGDEEAYRTKIRELGLESSVRFISDYVPNNKVAGYFSAADAVVLPYLSATQSGIVQIAYNFDKPVIATATGGLPEVVLDGRTGFIVPPDSPADLAKAMRRFYEERREQTFTEAVRIEKRNYTWDNLVKNIEQLMNGD